MKKAAGLAEPDPEYGTLWSVAAAFLDYDGDGDLDLFVSNYCVWDPKTEPLCGPKGLNDYCHPNNYKGLPNSLFRNEGDGTFTDVSVPSGIRKVVGKGMGLAVADYDGDGRTDVFVANDTEPNYLFHNLGDGTFEEIGFMAGDRLPGGRDGRSPGWAPTPRTSTTTASPTSSTPPSPARRCPSSTTWARTPSSRSPPGRGCRRSRCRGRGGATGSWTSTTTGGRTSSSAAGT